MKDYHTDSIMFSVVKFLQQRPIGVSMVVLSIIILGLVSLKIIPVSLLPHADIPRITVHVDAKNQSAEQIEQTVLKPLKQVLVQCNNLDNIYSQARNEHGKINMEFHYQSDMDLAFIEVNEILDRQMSSLPEGVVRPKVIKSSAIDLPVFYLNLTLDTVLKNRKGNVSTAVDQDFIDLGMFSTEIVKKRLEQMPQVAMADISGIAARELVIMLKEKKIQSLGISQEQLENVIKAHHVKIGNLLINEGYYEYQVQFTSELTGKKDIENIPVKVKDRIFMLKELATVVVKPQKRNGLIIENGKETVSLAIIKQSDAQLGDLKKELYELIEDFKTDYPQVHFNIIRDQAKLLDHSIKNLGQSMGLGIVLAIVILFFFLKSWKSPVLIAITVPLSLLGTLLVFHWFHISINILSLSGLILGVGMMVDNVIIVIDNIAFYQTKGLSLDKACAKGSSQVWGPMLSAVLTTCAVFIPLIFADGITGLLFYDQAMAVAIGLIISLVVSVTVLPVYYNLFHKHNGSKTTTSKNPIFPTLIPYEKWYEYGFRFIIRNPFSMLLIIVIVLGLGIFGYYKMSKSLFPPMVEREMMLRIDWNESVNLNESKRRVLLLMNSLSESIEYYHAEIGVQQYILQQEETAVQTVNMFLRGSKHLNPEDVKLKIKTILNNQFSNSIFTFHATQNIFTKLFTEKKWLTAKFRMVQTLVDPTEELNELTRNINTTFPGFDVPPFRLFPKIIVQFDHDKMARYDVSYESVKLQLQQALNEREVMTLNNGPVSLPVTFGGEHRTIGDLIQTLKIPRNDGTTNYPLQIFVKSVFKPSQKEVHADQVGIYFPVDFDISFRETPLIMGKINKLLDKSSFTVDYAGAYFDNQKMMKRLLFIFGVSICLLYFILAAQFESLWMPIIILLEIPISISGALAVLFFFDQSLNVMSGIGLIVTCGIVINDSILKIDTIIFLRAKGFNLIRALYRAGQRRLRPIIMTSLTTILALIPVLFASGLGTELQWPFAIALIGGMITGTLVSLYFIPICYFCVDRWLNKKVERR